MATKLQDSFGAVYTLLERPTIARRVVAFLLFIHTVLLGYSAYVHSPTFNEPGHLVAGLSYWRFGRFDVYNVNPPLVKMVAALPAMAAGCKEDWSGFYEGPGARPEMGMGEDFVAANGERSFFLFMIARWACIPFSWTAVIVCYLWARDLYGRPSGVMACLIWCFEPNILAHASLITPDAGATALGLVACYTFWRWLKKPTWRQAALTGVVLGLAELCKTTLILFYPLWPLMWLIYRWPDRRTMTARNWLREAGMLAVRMVIGLYVLNLGYGFEGSFTKLKDFHFVSDLFTGQPADSPPSHGWARGRSSDERSTSSIEHPASVNRFAGTWLGELPAPSPKNYISGIDIQQRDFEHCGRPSYFRGEWRDHGWWYYYLYACAIKVPLGLWLLGILAIASRYFPFARLTPDTEGRTPSVLPTADSGRPTAFWRDQFILLFPAIVIFTVVSSKTGFSEHLRYVLPAFPFFFVWVSGNCLTMANRGWYPAHEPRWGIIRVPLVSANLFALCWLVISSLLIFPHSLSYFNESIGGLLNAPKHLLGSNVDWGQDLRYLKWALEREGILKQRPIGLAYFGNFDPVSVGFGKSEQVSIWAVSNAPIYSSQAKSNAESASFTIAISVSLLYGGPWIARDCGGRDTTLSKVVLDRFASTRATSYAGYSNYIYYVGNFEN